MTQKQFDEIVQRLAQPPFGVPSQVKTDLSDLVSEIARRGGDFEPEPKTEEEPPHPPPPAPRPEDLGPEGPPE